MLFVFRETVRLLVGLVIAALATSALATLSVPHATAGLSAFLHSWASQLNGYACLQFGLSMLEGQSTQHELAIRLLSTARLVLEGLGIASMVGVLVGLLLHAGSLRRVIAPIVLLAGAMPVFCIALLLGFAATNVAWWRGAFAEQPAQAELLSVLTVGLAGSLALQHPLARAVTQTTRGTWRQHLLRMGLTSWDIDIHYVLPQACAGLLARFDEVILALLSAAVVTEWVFDGWGVAALFVNSVTRHDWSESAALLFGLAALSLTAGFAGRCFARWFVEFGAGT